MSQLLSGLKASLSEFHHERAQKFEDRGFGYGSKYQRTRELADLEASIKQHRKALDLTSKGDPIRADRLHALGNGYNDRYTHLGAITDLEASINLLQEALYLTSNDCPDDRALRLGSLSSLYQYKYHHQVGSVADLDASIEFRQKALELVPDITPEGVGHLQQLGIVHGKRYDRIGAIADLEASIHVTQKANDLIPDDDRYPAFNLNALGKLYSSRYDRKGGIEDLDMAFQMAQKALEKNALNPNIDGHSHRAIDLRQLGSKYLARYQRTTAMADLDKCTQLVQEALDLTPDNDPQRAHNIHFLAVVHAERYRRKGAKIDEEAAFRLMQEALARMPHNDPGRIFPLEHLGMLYQDRHLRGGAIEDLEESINLLRKALNLTPGDHPHRAHLVSTLGRCYENKYEKTNNMADLEASMKLYREALSLTPDDHPVRGDHLQDLGIGYSLRYKRTGVIMDMDKAIQRLQESLDHIISPPDKRLSSGRDLFRIFADDYNWLRAYDTAQTVVSLVPLLTSRHLETSDRQYVARAVTGWASDATAVALKANQSPYNALCLLELARGTITSSLNEMRTDISELRQQFPDVAAKFTKLRDQLDAGKGSTLGDQRYNVAREFDKVIEEIRSLPDFDRFLLAASENEMKAAAANGPVVVVNASQYGCDALIIEETSIRALQLSRLRYHDVRDRAHSPANTMSVDQDLLEWLWEAIASPIFEALGFLKTPTAGWPRIWWIPTGRLAKFPLHAAGRHFDGSSDTVMDRAISSYSSSVKALIHSRRDRPETRNPFASNSIVLVGMEQTPGQIRLPFVAQEIERLESLHKTMQMRVSRPQPLQQDVLTAVRNCKIFHFAGHGYSDSEDPSRSALLLEDGPLTVASLFETNLHNRKPFLAYLSACGTGQVRHDKLVDEGIHLIGACQLAGFPHVIGTLWEVNDQSCVDITMTTYEWIQKQGMSDAAVSEGLHRACRQLRGQSIKEAAARARSRRRNRGPTRSEQSQSNERNTRKMRDIEAADDVPLHWVPYVHFGV